MYKLSKKYEALAPIRERAVIALATFSMIFMFACSDPEPENADNADSADSADNTEQIDQGQGDNNTSNLGGLPQVEIPENYDLLSEAVGDLDGDGINEKAIAFNTGREGEMGFERELRIYSEHQGLWSLWHTAVGPILSSESGGVMGDPFEKLEIRKGQLEIFHFGGSADKWSYSHTFEHSEGNWELAAATLSFFRNCVYSETYTYDLNNGTGYHSKHSESCNENGEKIESALELEEVLNLDNDLPAPLLEEFIPGGTKVVLLNSDEPYFY
tara:strand:+ start:5868 stop:6680 length:813 start_codon:yes stop_codon:yes gene_type:complete